MKDRFLRVQSAFETYEVLIKNIFRFLILIIFMNMLSALGSINSELSSIDSELRYIDMKIGFIDTSLGSIDSDLSTINTTIKNK